MSGKRPTLTVGVLAHNAAALLPRFLPQASGFADELIVGVDEASTDGTLEVARGLADVVFRFRHERLHTPARNLLLRYATCDWILALDHDMSVDGRFPTLLPELLADSRYDAYAFPRKWLVAPLEYLRAAPWYPDWHLRLFRNDPRRVYYPTRIHAGYRVMGTPCFEDRAAFLHYHLLIRGDAERAARMTLYREYGSGGLCEEYYDPPRDTPRARVEIPPLPPPSRIPERTGRVVDEIIDLDALPEFPGWRARLEPAPLPPMRASARILTEVVATNTGTLSWLPTNRFPSSPLLNLSYHLYRGEQVVQRDERFPIPRVVDPGESTRFLCVLPAPSEPGEYRLEWDMVSELECWFAQAGSTPASVTLTVR